MNDTSVEIKEWIHSQIQNRSAEERMKMGSDSFSAARAMIIASMPKQLSTAEFNSQLFERIYGDQYKNLAKLIFEYYRSKEI